jgi:hypothetical protein
MTEGDLEELYSFISSRRDVPDRDREAAYAFYENFRFGREGARGCGNAPALTVAALSSAVDDGYKVGVPHSSPMAVTFYQELGFRDVAEFALYGPPDGFHL